MLRTLYQNRFLRASSIVFLGSVVANFLNYVFNLYMGRLLPPDVYGEMVALFTLLLIVSVPASTIILVLSKYTADFTAGGTSGSIALLSRATRAPIRYLSFLALVLALLASPLIATFLHVPLISVLIFTIIIPLSLLSAHTSGLLQGLQQFGTLSIMNIVNALFKFGLAVLFVILGFSLNGVIGALLISSVITYIYIEWRLARKIRTKERVTDEIRLDWRDLFRGTRGYIGLTFVATLVLAIFINIDTLLAKHFLSPTLAGEYAALSILGRIITYGSAAILTVLFPMTTASYIAHDGRTGRLLATAFVIVGTAGVVLTTLFGLYPEKILSMLFGDQYLAVAPYLIYFGLAMALSSLATVFVQYFLATNHKTFVYPLLILTVLEIVGIIIFHSSIKSIVLVSLLTSATLFVTLSIIYFLPTRRSAHA